MRSRKSFSRLTIFRWVGTRILIRKPNRGTRFHPLNTLPLYLGFQVSGRILSHFRLCSPKGHLSQFQEDKWKFTLGWTLREGPVLKNITYDGRSTFHRLSLSEMTVPYGDPRSPFHRKQAFDLGDSGLGLTSNSLELGCDCLGHIKYFDGCRIAADGIPVLMPNVVCMHEVDAGIGWKHTNFRSGTSSVVRNRQLVI
jgi:Cu2+-containing amine oxidase